MKQPFYYLLLAFGLNFVSLASRAQGTGSCTPTASVALGVRSTGQGLLAYQAAGTNGEQHAGPAWVSVRDGRVPDASGIAVPANGGVVTTLAGTARKVDGTDGMGAAARFNGPTGVAVDASGTLYVADTGNSTIRKITAAGVVTTLAGAAGKTGSADGKGAAARFNGPTGVAVDAGGTVYVADNGNHTIRKITAAGVVTTVAGTALEQGSTDGTGAAASFYFPFGVAVDAGGTLYIAELGNHTIRKITAAGVVTTLAGAAGSKGSTNGTGAAARFYEPIGVAADAAGTVYVGEQGNHTIRKITAAGVVTTLAGAARDCNIVDGTGAAARFCNPSSVAVDASGNLYVTDQARATIRKITAAGVVTTLAGTAEQRGNADGTGPAARFTFPSGVAVDATGTVYVADQGTHTIRIIK